MSGVHNTQHKLCGRCKKLIPLSKKVALCSSCASIERNNYIERVGVSDRQKEANKVYNSTRYKKARAECRRRAKGMCEVCLHFEKRKLGAEAHHIVTVLDGDDSTHYDVDNLIYCCKECHEYIEGMDREQLIVYLEGGLYRGV